MSLNLSKGNTLNLSKDFGLHKVSLELKWSKGYDLDSYVYTIDKHGVKNFIYFGNKKAEGILHHGDDLYGGGDVNKPNEIIDLDLTKQMNISDIYIGVFVYSNGVEFKDISFCEVSLRNIETNEVIATCGTEKLNGKSLLLSHIRNCNGEFKIKCISECSCLGYRKILELKNNDSVYKHKDVVSYLLDYNNNINSNNVIINNNNEQHEEISNVGCINRIKNFFKKL